MTVCIAAIYNKQSILGVSDRMVTGGYGDIAFEPPEPKILSLTNSIAVMTAGDQNIQMQVFREAYKIVVEKINMQPSKWLEVSEAAEIFSKCFYNLTNKLIEKQILSQYKLTLDSFIARQKQMNQNFIDMISSRIDRFQNNYIETIETIITGIDDLGPHIYVVKNGEISCRDKLGFASIGIGSGHAISHFMLSSYSPSALESKALLTIHQAKKKSEVSPGVGEETDLFVIGPTLGSFTMLQPVPGKIDIVKDLDKFYTKYKKKITKLDKETEKKIKNYIDQLGTETKPTQAASPNPSVSPSPSPSSSTSPSSVESISRSPSSMKTSKKRRKA